MDSARVSPSVSNFSIQDPQCCVETGFSREGALHSLEQVRYFPILSRSELNPRYFPIFHSTVGSEHVSSKALIFSTLQVVQSFAAGPKTEEG